MSVELFAIINLAFKALWLEDIEAQPTADESTLVPFAPNLGFKPHSKHIGEAGTQRIGTPN